MLTGGAIEYPVLTGVFMWLDALPAHNSTQFMVWTALMLLPVAYVLSTGPLLSAWKRGYIGDWIYWFYMPLKYCNQNIPAAKAFFDWYLELWGAA